MYHMTTNIIPFTLVVHLAIRIVRGPERVRISTFSPPLRCVNGKSMTSADPSADLTQFFVSGDKVEEWSTVCEGTANSTATLALPAVRYANSAREAERYSMGVGPRTCPTSLLF